MLNISGRSQCDKLHAEYSHQEVYTLLEKHGHASGYFKVSLAILRQECMVCTAVDYILEKERISLEIEVLVGPDRLPELG